MRREEGEVGRKRYSQNERTLCKGLRSSNKSRWNSLVGCYLISKVKAHHVVIIERAVLLDLERICDEEEYKFNKKREVVKSN
jgi:hypothetical protein